MCPLLSVVSFRTFQRGDDQPGRPFETLGPTWSRLRPFAGWREVAVFVSPDSNSQRCRTVGMRLGLTMASSQLCVSSEGEGGYDGEVASQAVQFMRQTSRSFDTCKECVMGTLSRYFNVHKLALTSRQQGPQVGDSQGDNAKPGRAVGSRQCQCDAPARGTTSHGAARRQDDAVV